MNEERQTYVRVTAGQCWQRRIGITPCFRAAEDAGVSCNLCPVQLFSETCAEAATRMFHDGTCLMDERNTAHLGGVARAKAEGGSVVATPLRFVESDVVLDLTTEDEVPTTTAADT